MRLSVTALRTHRTATTSTAVHMSPLRLAAGLLQRARDNTLHKLCGVSASRLAMAMGTPGARMSQSCAKSCIRRNPVEPRPRGLQRRYLCGAASRARTASSAANEASASGSSAKL